MVGSSLALRPPKHLGFRATLSAILGASVAYATGCDGLTCIFSASLAAVTMRIAIIDFKIRIIYDLDVIAMLIISLNWNFWANPNLDRGIVSALLGGIFYAFVFQMVRMVYLLIRGREGLGFGDVKLALAAGTLLDVELFALAIFAASIVGIIEACVINHIRRRLKSKYSYVPFGHALIITTYIFWLASVTVFV